MNVAIIPARGGSKRIPHKNTKLFSGKPIIAYSIEAALNTEQIDRVIVSTDCAEIAAVAKKFGAEVPFTRPSDISDDYATTLDVMQHAIEWLIDSGETIANVCCLYATAPFVRASDLSCAFELLADDTQYVFSATEFGFPIQRAIRLGEHGEVSMFSDEYANTRSQDLEEAFHDAGQFYWGTTEAFRNKLAIFAPHSRIFKLPRERVQDIDTPDDWRLAELMYQSLTALDSN